MRFLTTFLSVFGGLSAGAAFLAGLFRLADFAESKGKSGVLVVFLGTALLLSFVVQFLP